MCRILAYIFLLLGELGKDWPEIAQPIYEHVITLEQKYGIKGTKSNIERPLPATIDVLPRPGSNLEIYRQIQMEEEKRTLKEIIALREKANELSLNSDKKHPASAYQKKSGNDADEPRKSKQKGRYRLTKEEIQYRNMKVKEADKIKKENPEKTWKQIALEMDL